MSTGAECRMCCYGRYSIRRMSKNSRHLITPVTLLGFVDVEPARARLVLTQPHIEKRKGGRVTIDLSTSSPAPDVPSSCVIM
jgi:hypothetical protein